MRADIDSFKNRVFSAIVVPENKDVLYFIDEDKGEYLVMRHDQQCCESVSLEDIDGDLKDLTYSPIYEAEEVINQGDCKDECFTWTFYKFRSGVGFVTIRWYGCSNGYYSEEVDIYKYKLKDFNPQGEVHRRIPYWKEVIPKSLDIGGDNGSK